MNDQPGEPPTKSGGSLASASISEATVANAKSKQTLSPKWRARHVSTSSASDEAFDSHDDKHASTSTRPCARETSEEASSSSVSDGELQHRVGRLRLNETPYRRNGDGPLSPSDSSRDSRGRGRRRDWDRSPQSGRRHHRRSHERSPSPERPTDWIKEQTHDERDCWRNVHTLEMSWSTPMIWQSMGEPTLPLYEHAPSQDGTMRFRNVRTGAILMPHRVHVDHSEKRRKDLRLDESHDVGSLVSASDTATGRKIFQLDERDIIRRSGHVGSTRSVFDREKYYTTFKCVIRRDGSSGRIILPNELHGDRVVAHLTDAAQVKLYKQNPHLNQVFVNGRAFVQMGRALTAADRVAPASLEPRLSYKRRQGEVKTVEHWGQRKLLLSEIEFLCLHGHRAKKVVYAGAAPGDHINFLSGMFPDMKWLLVDPASFVCAPSDRIKLRQTYFTNELAEALRDEDTLFICDVRSMDNANDPLRKESRVQVDMEWQEQWVKLMRPKAAMLKFRLPYTDKCAPDYTATHYLNGDVYLPVWGGRTTTETRLIVTDPDAMREYDHQMYEDFMFHFNTVTRTSFFDVPLSDEEMHRVGLDHCFDCASELHVLRAYRDLVLQRTAVPAAFVDDSSLSHCLCRLVASINLQCSKSHRSLALPCYTSHFQYTD